jgi:iron complex outermembrane receptor protein
MTRLAASPRILAALIGLSATSIAFAQQLEEVVVTAQYRQENLQDVPITITTISSDALIKRDIFDAATIAQATPGLAYAEFAPGQAYYTMRGIGSGDDGAGLDNSVALFLDGVYIGRNAGVNFDMFDLERIEVLRGPQGTLSGRNAIGGAIRLVTAKPTDELQVQLGATAGNEGILRYQGLVSGPLGSSLSGKLSLTHREHDGFVENVILGKRQQDENQTSVRAQLRWAQERGEWLLSGDWMEDDRGDMGRTPVIDNAPLQLIMAQNGVTGPRQNAAPRDGFSDRQAWGLSLQGQLDFDRGSLTSITAWRSVSTDWEMASVGAPLGGLGLPFDEVIDDIIEDVETLSQELRWTSSLGGEFEYTAGIFYFQEDTDRSEIFRISQAGIYGDPALPLRLTAPGSQAILGNEYARTANRTTSYAAYGQGEWAFAKDWKLTVGARYTVDQKDYTAESVNCWMVAMQDPALAGTRFENFAACGGVGGSLGIIAETFEVNPSDEWQDFSPRLALAWQLRENVLLFGSVAKGFKSGGFAGSQGVESAASTPVDPETAISYEFGMKGDFADRFRLNVTGFNTDYKDLQVVRFGPVPESAFGTFITTNIGKARIIGAELEGTWYVTERLRLEGYYAALDTKTKGLVLETVGGIVDASNKSLAGAPPSSWNLSLAYALPTARGNFEFQLAHSYTGGRRFDYVDDRIRLEPNRVTDARIGWTAAAGNWDVALWGKNLTDEDYIADIYIIGPGGIGVWGPPRTWGVTLSWRL